MTKKRPDADTPLTTTEFKQMKKFSGLDGLEAIVGKEAVTPLRGKGRPPIEHPKQRVTLRLDETIIETLRASGKGWQTRLNAALRDLIERGVL